MLRRDKNAIFSHHYATFRRRKNNIDGKKKDNLGSTWIFEPKEFFDYCHGHFKEIYTSNGEIKADNNLEVFDNVIIADVNNSLNDVTNIEEIKSVVFKMGKYKAPGTDGFQLIFFTTY